MSCHRAGKLRNVRFLSNRAPAIPLPGCDMAKECTCHFKKHNDRRQGGDRRLFGCLPDSRFFSGQDRRRPGGRRAIGSSATSQAERCGHRDGQTEKNP